MEGNAILACDNEYFFKKLYQSYVFSDEIDNILNKIDPSSVIFYNDSLLNYLEELVEHNYNFHYLDEYVKNNIIEMLTFLRNCNYYVNSKNYEEVIDKINNMIRKINVSKEENVYDFYFSEVIQRLDLSKRAIRNIKSGKLQIVFEDVRMMICSDIILLLNLNASEKDYDVVFNELIYNEMVLYSLRKMICENPIIFKDDRTLDRAKEILLANYVIFFRDNGSFNFIKENTRVYKKLEKLKKDK